MISYQKQDFWMNYRSLLNAAAVGVMIVNIMNIMKLYQEILRERKNHVHPAAFVLKIRKLKNVKLVLMKMAAN